MSKPNQDIRDYMADHGVSQRMLASEIGVSQFTINKKLQTELSQKDKEAYLNLIDAIAAEANRRFAEDVLADEPSGDDEEFDEDVSTPPENSCITVFQIGDRVKIPSKSNKIGTICDIWQSMVKAGVMYAEVGLAQAISYAAKRMFESLDTKQENKIYFK